MTRMFPIPILAGFSQTFRLRMIGVPSNERVVPRNRTTQINLLVLVCENVMAEVQSRPNNSLNRVLATCVRMRPRRRILSL